MVKNQYPALSIKLQILSNACFCILQVVLCSFAAAFFHPGDEGLGAQKSCFQFGVVQVFHSPLLVWGLFPCSAAGCLSQQCWVIEVRKSYFIVFPLQDNPSTTGWMRRGRKCVDTAWQHSGPCCGKVVFGSCIGHLLKYVTDVNGEMQLLGF